MCGNAVPTRSCYTSSWYWLIPGGANQGRNQLFISGGAIIMKFYSMMSSCLFNRGTTFSQTVTDKFLFATFSKMRTFQF